MFGLGLSIPLVVFSSNLLADLMERFPATIYLGVAILGKVGGDMVLEDPFLVRTAHPTETARYLVDGALVVALLVAGWRLGAARRKHAATPA